MKRTTLFAVVGIPAVIAVLVGIKASQFSFLMAMGEEYKAPPVKVTFASIAPQQWEDRLQSVGTLEAVDGITLTAEVQGKIEQIAFTPGAHVNAGDLLVQQDIRTEQAQLKAAEAAAQLANSTLERSRRMMKQNGVSISDLETAEAQAKQAAAQVEQVKALIAKKSLRAPFSGRLGVRQVSLGQDLQAGAQVVILQKLDPILVNFFIPQRQLSQLQEGLPVRITVTDLDNLQVEGVITAINPQIDPNTRNVKVQARLQNADERLLPGMFVSVDVVLPNPRPVLAVPATAILYAPFGNSLFIIEDSADGQKVVRQQIVQTGITRGDFIEIRQGLQGNETIVTTGAFKLINGQAVEPDNSQSPAFSLNPKPDNA